MWAGMVGVSLNADPIKLDYSVGVVLGLLIIVGIVSCLAFGRLRRRSFFTFDGRRLLGNLPRHLFILTGVVFIGFLFFAGVIQILILTFDVPIFDQYCVKPSQHDVALFVWDAMAWLGRMAERAEHPVLYVDLAGLACSQLRKSVV